MSELEMKGKKVFITGASRGIGKAIALEFQRKGAYVIGSGTNESAPPECNWLDDYVVADFSDIDQLYKCRDALLKLEPDVLINNAGINKISSFSDISPNDFLRIQQVNVFAPFILSQAAILSMKKKGWGRLVSLTSIWGVVSKAYRASYSTSKFALDGLTLSIALEYGCKGILANSVAPGITNTELTRKILEGEELTRLISAQPLGRMAEVEEVARLVTWLGGAENTYVNGQNIAIDGGFVRA